MNQTKHRFDYPLTGSLSWWLCLTTKQTVIHMSLLWPRFHLEQFHRGRWKRRSWRVRDLNPSPASTQQPLPRREKNSLCHSLSEGGFVYVASMALFFFFLLLQVWEECDSEEFPSTCLSLFWHLSQSFLWLHSDCILVSLPVSTHLVSVVKSIFKSAFTEKEKKKENIPSAGLLGRSLE